MKSLKVKAIKSGLTIFAETQMVIFVQPFLGPSVERCECSKNIGESGE